MTKLTLGQQSEEVLDSWFSFLSIGLSAFGDAPGIATTSLAARRISLVLPEIGNPEKPGDWGRATEAGSPGPLVAYIAASR